MAGMTLTLCTDISPGTWMTDSPLPWTRLIAFGPDVFERYARVRLLPDPVYPGQSEHEVHLGNDDFWWRRSQWSVLWGALASDLDPAEPCYVCFWEGTRTVVGEAAPRFDAPTMTLSELYRDGELPEGFSWAPVPLPASVAAADPAADVPRVSIPNRDYFLFRTSARDLPAIAEYEEVQVTDQVTVSAVEPAFVWPASRAWCAACDVDAHAVGLGANAATVERLLALPGLDCVPADPAAEQPAYR